jgi:histone deacetylase complex regulatory component SIN3
VAIMSQPPSTTDGKKEIKVRDALSYLDRVKRRFSNKLAIYQEFLQIMKDFKNNKYVHALLVLFRG